MTSQVRNLRCRSIGVREATDLIRKKGGVGCGGGGGDRTFRTLMFRPRMFRTRMFRPVLFSG